MDQPRFTPKEEKKLSTLLAKGGVWPTRLEVGNRLVELSSGSLRLAPKKDYIAVQPLDADTRSRRNAISLLKEGVSFTVYDWSVENELAQEGLTGVRGESTKLKTIKRLRFPVLELTSIEQNLLLFTKLVTDAAKTITGHR